MGVSPRGTLLRGQSIIEYVLIIAVIGLVIVFAGPGVAGAIRNQFNLVGNTVNSGTTEVYGNLQANGHLQSDGSQYEYYAFKGVTQEKFSGASSGSSHWTRSVCLDGSQYFRYVHSNGDWSNHGYTATDFVFPAWCF